MTEKNKNNMKTHKNNLPLKNDLLQVPEKILMKPLWNSQTVLES